MDNIAIDVKNIVKIFNIYEKPSDRLKEALSIRGEKYHTNFYALNNISFYIEKGETIGIIGVNGSGKSTLLKIITGVLSQTEGNINVNGNISALLELGAGFNPEYTGIENIYLQGTILGYTEEQVEEKIDDILSFADIGDFIYQPVKTYSSGMFVRLAFSVSINVKPEILIVDEALAVGDIFFQNKCYKKFKELKEDGTTILFVSHDISSVKQYCNRAIWLDGGSIKRIGDTKSVCEEYFNYQIEKRNEDIKGSIEDISSTKYSKDIYNKNKKIEYKRLVVDEKTIGGTGEGEILSFFILNNNKEETNLIEVENEYLFIMLSKLNKDIKNVIFGFTIEDTKGVLLYATNTYMNNKLLSNCLKDKVYEIKFKIKIPKILKGRYLISPAIAAGTQDKHKIIAWYNHATEIEIINNGYNQALIEIENDIEINQVDNIEFI